MAVSTEYLSRRGWLAVGHTEYLSRGNTGYLSQRGGWRWISGGLLTRAWTGGVGLV